MVVIQPFVSNGVSAGDIVAVNMIIEEKPGSAVFLQGDNFTVDNQPLLTIGVTQVQVKFNNIALKL